MNRVELQFPVMTRRLKAYLLPGRVENADAALARIQNDKLRLAEDLEISGSTSSVGLFVFSGSELVGAIESLTNFTALPDFSFSPENNQHIYPYAISNQQQPQKYEFTASRQTTAQSHKQRWQSAPMMRYGDAGDAPGAAVDGEFDPAVVAKLRELFEQRPVWQRMSLEEHLEDSDKSQSWRLSAALRQVSYFFLDGPWRNAYVKFGYDPRKVPDSRYFQMLDFRDPFFRTAEGAKGSSGGVVDCHFRVPPANRSQQYQLCDIDDSAIQALLKGSKPQSACTAESGWLAPEQLESIRNQLKVKSEAMRRGRLQVGK